MSRAEATDATRRVSASRIVVTRRLAQPALDRLAAAGDTWVSPAGRPLERVELEAAVTGASAVVTMLYDRVDDDLLDRCGPGLQVVANVAVGYDNVDVAAATRRGVLVTNTPGVLTDATADLTIGLVLAVTRRLGEGERLVRRGEPWRWDLDFMLGTDLRDRTLGIVGLGAIGTAVARRARAFGMRLAYSARSPADPALEAELRAARLPLDDLLATSDVVSLHCPLTPETHHLLDAQRLARMPRHAYLVNTARGAIVDEAALAGALSAGRLAGAALDVFEHEPRVHPDLLGRDDVVLVPHLGSATVATRTAMADLAARNVAAVLGGGRPLTPVNPEILTGG